MAWILAIDFGTTSTAAARRTPEGRIEPIQLEGAPRMPSMVFWREATGSASTGHLVLGQEADQLSGSAPWCLERSPKRRLGEEFMQLGDQQLRVVEVIGQILRSVYNEALTLAGGEPPAETRLTHPARWGKTRLKELGEAARIAGITDPTFVPEPVAAATHFASARLKVGEHVAVYDLGGGTLDTAVLKRTEDSFEVVGKPGGNEDLGGEDFDDLLYRNLGEQLPGDIWHKLRTAGEGERAYAQANRELLRQARRAKEGLSTRAQYELYMPPPIDAELEASAAELERLLAPTLRGTVAELESTIRAAGLDPSEIAAIYLAGGSSRIPLVGRLIGERLGVTPEPLDDPKAVVALGAARLETKAEPESVPEPAPQPPLPPPPDDKRAETVAAAGGGEETIKAASPPVGGRRTRPGDRGQRPDYAGRKKTTRELTQEPASNRRRILYGAGGLLAVGAAVAAALVLAGGGGGGGTTTTTTTDTQSSGDQLEDAIKPQYRDSCSTLSDSGLLAGATAGFKCTNLPGTGGQAIYLEGYATNSALLSEFDSYIGSLGSGDCSNGWNVHGVWFSGSRSNTRGKLACRDRKNGPEMIWTDGPRGALGFVEGRSTTSRSENYQAWSQVVN
jgi:Hsp70 protein